MQQPPNEPLHWNHLKSRDNDNLPPREGSRQIFVSFDHLIVLVTGASEVYTFHLKEFYWSKHQINFFQQKKSMNFFLSSLCIAHDGLILYLNQKTIHLLTFETENNKLKNFCLREKDLGLQFSPESLFLQAHQKSVYILAYQRSSVEMFELDLESYKISTLKAHGIIPNLEIVISVFLENDRFYVLGGQKSSELWVLNISQMKWKQLSNTDSSSIKDFPSPQSASPQVMIQKNQIFLFVPSTKGSFIFSRSMNGNYWKKLSELQHLVNARQEITLSGESIILLDESGVYSLDLCSSVQKLQGLEKFLQKIFEEKPFTDVVFEVEKKDFPANKCILSARCPYFHNMFTSGMKESQEEKILIKGVRVNVFKVFLNYIYFQKYTINKDIAKDLFELSHEYMIEKLQADCLEFLSKDLKIDNAMETILLAEKYEAHQLQEACITFIGPNYDAIFKNPEDIKKLKGETIAQLIKNKK